MSSTRSVSASSFNESDKNPKSEESPPEKYLLVTYRMGQNNYRLTSVSKISTGQCDESTTEQAIRDWTAATRRELGNDIYVVEARIIPRANRCVECGVLVPPAESFCGEWCQTKWLDDQERIATQNISARAELNRH
jgi:predicted nucleic acid-binding Zn ribbon protein